MNELTEKQTQDIADQFMRQIDSHHGSTTAITRADAEDFARAIIAEDRAQRQAEPEDFDTWMKNPYTAVLHKSIAEDYVPRHDQERQAVHEPALAVLREFVDAFDGVIAQGGCSVTIDDTSSGWVSRARAALSAPQPAAQPVQPDHVARELAAAHTQNSESIANSCKSAQPAVQPAVEPLTDEQIEEVCRNHISRDKSKDAVKTGFWPDSIALCRAIEQAHGITATQGATHE